MTLRQKIFCCRVDQARKMIVYLLWGSFPERKKTGMWIFVVNDVLKQR